MQIRDRCTGANEFFGKLFEPTSLGTGELTTLTSGCGCKNHLGQRTIKNLRLELIQGLANANQQTQLF